MMWLETVEISIVCSSFTKMYNLNLNREAMNMHN